MTTSYARTAQNTFLESKYFEADVIIDSKSATAITVYGSDSLTPIFQVDSVANTVTYGAPVSFSSATFTSILGGASSILFKNNAGTQTNLTITDAGAATIDGRSTTLPVLTLNAPSLAVTDGSTTQRSWYLNGSSSSLTNPGGSARGLEVTHHFTGANSIGTASSGYFFMQHDGTGTVTDLFALVGRTYITSTGTGTNTWGVRGDILFTGAGTITTGANLWAKQLTQFAGSSITTHAGLMVDNNTFTTTTVQDAYGAYIGLPLSSTGHKIGVSVGVPAATASYTQGLVVWQGGATIKGSATLPLADTSNNGTIMFLQAGDNAAANNTGVLLYFYRGAAAQGYIGYDTNVSQVNAGHTKLLTDLTVGSVKLLVDTNGQIFSANGIFGNSMSIVPTVKASGTIGTSFLYTGAAHTGLTPGSFAEFNFNAARTVSWDNSGTTIATGYTFQFQKPVYSSAAAMTMSQVATVRITGAPTAASTAGFSPTLTLAYALQIDAGTSRFDGAIHMSPATAVTAGGSTTKFIGLFGTTGTPTLGVYAGSGAPTIAAGQGSLYLRTDGSTTITRAYINTDGSTTWTPITTVG